MGPVLFSLLLAAAQAAEPELIFVSKGTEVLRVTASSLRARPDARIVDVADPFYGRRKRFRAVPLKSLFSTAYSAVWAEDTLGEVFFASADGYEDHVKTGVLMADGGWLAFDDAEVPGWEEIPDKGSRAGPFYLFWTGGEQRPRNGYPWPMRIVSIRTGLLEDVYPKAVPRGAGADSPVVRGWAIFQRDCIVCHAMSGQGGSVGPDLNEPKGVTRFHSAKQLKAYIKKASEFRHTKMPDFDGLSKTDLNDLMAYLDHMAERTDQAKGATP